MEFDSGLIISEELDSDGELQLEFDGEPNWLALKELRYILKHGQNMIDNHFNKEWVELQVNPSMCDGCKALASSNEEWGIEYHCREIDYRNCGRVNYE